MNKPFPLAIGVVALAAVVSAAAPQSPVPGPAAPGAAAPGAVPAAVRFEAQEIQRDFGVGYAVTVADVNADKRPDVIAISGTRLVWYENPGTAATASASASASASSGAAAAPSEPRAWTTHVLLDGQTPKDNVTLAPHDIDGDGRLDVALGAAWNPRDTNGGGTLHWVNQRGAGEPWTLRDIASEPTLHRIRWANVDGRGAPELIVAPLHGRGTSPPEWNGPGARLLVFRIPAKPAAEKWEMEVADDTLHIFHNFTVARFDADERDDLLTSSREGVHVLRRDDEAKWTRTKLGEGTPGEIKLGRVGGRRVIATVEPWHGNAIVLYLEPPSSAAPGTLWTRRVIEEQLAGAHALGWADIDGDDAGDEELVVGWRDKEGGVALYDLDREGAVKTKTMIDAGGMATEDLTIADLDGDRRPDVIASGRRTANVKIYWNRIPRAAAR